MWLPGLGAAPGGRVGLGVETHQAGVGFGIDAKDLTGCAEDETGCFLKAILINTCFGAFQISGYPCVGVCANGVVGVELIPDPVGVVSDCDGVVGGHGPRVGVEAVCLRCAYPTPWSAMVNPTVWRLLRTCHNPGGRVGLGGA
jgi:hypothetical protein